MNLLVLATTYHTAITERYTMCFLQSMYGSILEAKNVRSAKLLESRDVTHTG